MREKNLKDSELYERRFGWKEKRSNSRFMLVFALLMAALLSFVCWFHANFSGVKVSGPSMQKTLMGGEYLLMDEAEVRAKCQEQAVDFWKRNNWPTP